MSTLTKFSAIPYTGPAPTNREPYVPANADAADARGSELAARLGAAQETRQDLPTLIVEKDRLLDTLRALKRETFTMPLECFGVDYPNREKRFDVVYQFYSLDKNERVRLKVRTGEEEPIPSGVGIFKGLNWF